ncbi:hypothetical protein [Streptomyces alfalfae]|uniref:hypothetical protein n=1 Tax=Streptomyces alfalfae TaxID=1642299 RepID=UPI002810B238|nr:hypothetical protein [Streptomyces alfalfae]
MRLCSSPASGVATAVALALALSLAVAVLGAPARAGESTVVAPAPARPGPLAGYEPSCAPADRADFPIDARIPEGPRTYRPGGGEQEWSVALTNATGEPCDRVHPLVVLVGEERSLRPEHIRLEFHDGSRWHPVAFHRTDQRENVGVFDHGFGGFTVKSGETVTAKVRMGFTGDAPAGGVTATAALVQRKKNDGDWVGESNPYTFDIEPDAPAILSADQLAQTGERFLIALGGAAGILVLGGAALIAGARRHRGGTAGGNR